VKITEKLTDDLKLIGKAAKMIRCLYVLKTILTVATIVFSALESVKLVKQLKEG